ncbi:MAG: tetratricopeptide repeat protein [Pseudohongiellaceae bacterium]
MRSRIEANPGDFQAHLQLGIVLFKEEAYFEARESLMTAYELLPSYTGYPSPPLVLSQIAQAQNDEQARLDWLEVLLENLQHDYDSALILAEAALQEENYERADYYLDRALQVDPYRSDVHQLKARYAQATGNTAQAVTEYEVLMSLDINDPVEARTDLAEAYLSNGQRADARQNVLYALELAPSYRRAQEVLLQSLEGDN